MRILQTKHQIKKELIEDRMKNIEQGFSAKQFYVFADALTDFEDSPKVKIVQGYQNNIRLFRFQGQLYQAQNTNRKEINSKSRRNYDVYLVEGINESTINNYAEP